MAMIKPPFKVQKMRVVKVGRTNLSVLMIAALAISAWLGWTFVAALGATGGW